MSAKPRITVVIPCFNVEQYVVAAVQSALDQDWPDLEVLVVDDGSTDQSTQRVRSGCPGARLLTQVNQGAAAARNMGIRAARGDWIAFLDADDIWLPGKLQAQWQLLQEAPAAQLACTDWHVWSSKSAAPLPAELAQLEFDSRIQPVQPGPSGWIYPELLLDCVVWTSTVLAKRTLFDEIGHFDTTLRVGEDYDLWLRASRVTPIVRVAQRMALYRSHPASLTKKAPQANYRAQVLERALARWGYSGPDGRRARKADVDRVLASTWIDFAHAHLTAGNRQRAREASFKSIRATPWQARGWRMVAKAYVPRFLAQAAIANK